MADDWRKRFVPNRAMARSGSGSPARSRFGGTGERRLSVGSAANNDPATIALTTAHTGERQEKFNVMAAPPGSARPNAIGSHPRPEHRRDDHRAIGLLIIFQNR